MKSARRNEDDLRSRLPLADPSVDALTPAVRMRIARQWAERSTAELRVAGVFAVVARGLMETGAEPVVLRIAGEAVADEMRHAEICRLLAERYAGREVPWPRPGKSQMPKLARAPAALRPTLHAVAMGCINETIASAWLEASLHDATAPLARAALRELIGDDVHHARLGWAHLASSFVDGAMRRTIGGWLPGLLEAVVRPWLRGGRYAMREGAPEHGVPKLETTRDVVRGTVEEIVIPGFERSGVPLRAARRWCARAWGEDSNADSSLRSE